MNRQPTNAEQREFWELCGLSYVESTGVDWSEHWVLPNGEKGGKLAPAIDLNNLFRWAGPKVYEDCGLAIFAVVLYRWFEGIIREINNHNLDEIVLGLFWAIYPVLKEAKK